MAWSKRLDRNFKLWREENERQAETKQVQQNEKKKRQGKSKNDKLNEENFVGVIYMEYLMR